jgi:hypothetical protein
MVCGKSTKKATILNNSSDKMAVNQVLILRRLKLRRKLILSIFIVDSSAIYYNQMYNMPEFNLIMKEEK